MVAAMIMQSIDSTPSALQESRQFSQQARQSVMDPLLATCLALDRLTVTLRAVSPEHAMELEVHLQSIRGSIRALSALELELYPTLLADLGLEAALLHIKEQFKQGFPDCAVDCLIDLHGAVPNFVQGAAICRLVNVTLAGIRRSGTAIGVSIRVTKKEAILQVQIQEDHGQKRVNTFPAELPSSLIGLANFVKSCGGEFDYKIRRGGPRVSASWQDTGMWSPWLPQASLTE
jgi:signal transduction histidine kinase